MKRLMFLLALLFAGCQTTPELKDCNVLAKEVAAEQAKQGRRQVDGGTDQSGLTLMVYWDMVAPTVEFAIFVPPNYPLDPNAGLEEVAECTLPSKAPGEEATVWKYYRKTVPVSNP